MKVTFFVMGPWAQKYQDVAKRMVTDGHEIASHGYRHQNYGTVGNFGRGVSVKFMAHQFCPFYRQRQ